MPNGNDEKQVDILIAIDGTGSKEWIERGKDDKITGGNSHVFRFYKDLLTAAPPGSGYFKAYFSGPVTSGSNVPAIVAGVVKLVKEKLEKVPSAHVSMVGHSRGGLIALLACRDLEMPIKFLGLYDAVDRAYGPRVQKVPDNVKFTCHARRDVWATRSRTGFGNCGIEKGAGKYVQKFFKATHGSIGGDAVGAQETESEHTGYITAAAMLLGPLVAAAVHSQIKVRVSLEDDRQAGIAADRFIRDGAHEAGLRIAG